MTPPFHDNPTAPPSTATGEQRTLLKVTSTVLVANDKRSTKGWCSCLAAATLLLVCLVRSSGVVPTVHYSPLLRGNTAGSTSGSRSSEMSAVHYVPDAGKGEACLEFWGTSCGSELSCDNNHVCQDNAGPGQPCGNDANGIDCVAGYYCQTYTDDDDDFNDQYTYHSQCEDHFW